MLVRCEELSRTVARRDDVRRLKRIARSFFPSNSTAVTKNLHSVGSTPKQVVQELGAEHQGAFCRPALPKYRIKSPRFLADAVSRHKRGSRGLGV
jgi:hypothetical protein